MEDFDDDLDKILKMNPSNFKEPTSLKSILPFDQLKTQKKTNSLV